MKTEFEDMMYFTKKYQKSLDKQRELTFAGAPWSKIEKEIARGEKAYRQIAEMQEAFMRKKFGINPGDMIVPIPPEIVQVVLTFSEKAV